MTNDPFLPDNYSEPNNSDYVRLEPWTYKIRFIESPILTSVKREEKEVDGKTKNIKTIDKLDPSEPIPVGSSIARACLVYNYTDRRVQLWEITQKSIREQIVTIYKDPDFGDLRNYDIKVTRTWSWQNDTKYSIQALSKEKIGEEVKKAVMQTPINWDIYFDNNTNESPFANKKKEETEDDDLLF